ncbi:MAG: Hpt domain-containing protein [Coriobacteriia bacterium]|nr:Hpt domain-containing protein [Coriobacteriia bacterium]MDO9108019.1 Hpt domain-containing protein [Coriobacteriia bacterium]
MSANATIAYVDESLESLIPRYLARRAADVEALRHAMQQGAFEEAKVIGHRLKGSGGGYGFDPITDIGATIERAANESDKVTLSAATEELEEYLVKVEVVFVDEEE